MAIRVSLSLVKPESSAEYASLEAVIDSAKLAALVVPDNVSGNRFAFDQAAPLDITIINTTKIFADHSTVASRISSKATSKGLSDSAGLVDEVTTLLLIRRRFDDTASVSSEIRNINSSKALSDSYYGVTSSPIFRIGKLLQDRAYATDDFFGETNVDDDQSMLFTKVSISSAASTDNFDRTVSFNRAFDDAVEDQIVDSFGISYAKPTTSSAASTDNFDRTVSFIRAFDDAVEDQIVDSFDISYAKSTTSPAASTDNFDRTVSFNRVFDDVVEDQVIDSLDISSTKVFVENYFATDSINQVDVVKSLTNDASTQTQTVINLSTTKQDVLSASELFTREVAFSRAFTDNKSAVDNARLLLDKPFDDSFSAQDTFTRSVTSSRFFTDQVFLTDDINGLASIDDDQTMLFNKFVTSTIITNSDPRLSLTKNITDSGAVSDSGELYAQGYMNNMDYFALGYVGTTGSF